MKPPRSAAIGRAGYHIPVNHFLGKRRPRARSFEQQRLDALAGAAAGSREILLDQREDLGLPFAATTPTMLASYVVLRAGDELRTEPHATALICMVLRGSGGASEANGEIHHWEEGDVLVLPAGGEVLHRAGAAGALLFTVSDAPLGNYLRTRADAAAPIEAAHYPGDTLRRMLRGMDEDGVDPEAVGRAIIFTRADRPGEHLTTPFFISNLNTLEAGADQRTHRHNGAAITLSLQGEGCHSMVGDDRVDWTPLGAMVTPAGMPHSHHNRGPSTMLSLVVQDSGFYEHAGVPGFAFDPQADARWKAAS
jgi:gentisate 1,2-dioxygenase